MILPWQVYAAWIAAQALFMIVVIIIQRRWFCWKKTKWNKTNKSIELNWKSGHKKIWNELYAKINKGAKDK